MEEGVAVGIDVAKDFHWVQAVDRRDSEPLFSGSVDNTPSAIAALIEQLEGLRDRGRLTAGIDVVGGIAGLLTAMLLEAGIEVVHVSGLAVNRAREGTSGGEHKSDPRDAAVIADQVRHRRDLRRIEPAGELDAEIRLLVARRRELVTDQTRRISRLRDLLASIHPGLEHVVDPTTKAGRQLLRPYVTPSEIRRAGPPPADRAHPPSRPHPAPPRRRARRAGAGRRPRTNHHHHRRARRRRADPRARRRGRAHPQPTRRARPRTPDRAGAPP
jgi:hypothetical protein